MTIEQKGGTIAISWGEYGGFYIQFGDSKRICFGWVALTYIPYDFDYLLEGFSNLYKFWKKHSDE